MAAKASWYWNYVTVTLCIRLALWCSLIMFNVSPSQVLMIKTLRITKKQSSRSVHRRQKVRRCRAWGDRDRWRQTEPQTAQDSCRQTPVSQPTSWHTARQITTVPPRPIENTNRKSYIHTTANSTRQLPTNSSLTANQLKHSQIDHTYTRIYTYKFIQHQNSWERIWDRVVTQ